MKGVAKLYQEASVMALIVNFIVVVVMPVFYCNCGICDA